ncbi:hypothetical protein KDK_66720 [Dictyobacter kobayashii]|uniref:Uncharacterized protein n=1 Tax=Dictyobacter kobayashii TaxID=2014872 RepID=A0A402AUS7_9CHLR|nr:hypothetical protein KDK_66720 [Dictyobacter kobayashii]
MRKAHFLHHTTKYMFQVWGGVWWAVVAAHTTKYMFQVGGVYGGRLRPPPTCKQEDEEQAMKDTIFQVWGGVWWAVATASHLQTGR